MKKIKRSVKILAKNYKVDVDHLLISLWDLKCFKYISNENSVVRKKDLNKIKDIIYQIINRKEPVFDVIENKKNIKLINKDFDFSVIGRINNQISYITKNELLTIYKELQVDFNNSKDPILPAGVKDIDALESALFHPQTSYCKKRKYPTVESSAAALIYSISQNHPFHNGNKRTSLVSMLVFLDRHNFRLKCDDNELFKLSIRIADHKLVSPEYLYCDAEIHEIARWIHGNGRLEERGERLITFKRLKQILAYFNCKIIDNGKIERIIYHSFLGIRREKKLYSSQFKSNLILDGEEIDRGIIKSIREDLELDSAHNIDSKVFYEQIGFSSSEFINKYKNIIKRLSKL